MFGLVNFSGDRCWVDSSGEWSPLFIHQVLHRQLWSGVFTESLITLGEAMPVVPKAHVVQCVIPGVTLVTFS